MIKIPAKTFLLGEYAVLAGHPALLLLTEPFFEISLGDGEQLEGIHPDSPAGRYWKAFGSKGLVFHDPYEGIGGLGASSAQFLGAYLLAHPGEPLNLQALLDAYHASSWDGEGLRPSGYDVLAQRSSSFCVYVERTPLAATALHWDFQELGLLLIHMGAKCQTHQHLHQLNKLPKLDELSDLVHQAKNAILQHDAAHLCECVNRYEARLRAYGWVSDPIQSWVDRFRAYPFVRAAKGCGAMGADVVVLLVDKAATQLAAAKVASEGLRVLLVA